MISEGKNLKCREFLDYFRDCVNGLGIWEQAVGDWCDDVKGTLEKLPWVSAIQLPGPEDTIDAVPWKRGENTLVFTQRNYSMTQICKTYKIHEHYASVVIFHRSIHPSIIRAAQPHLRNASKLFKQNCLHSFQICPRFFLAHQVFHNNIM